MRVATTLLMLACAVAPCAVLFTTPALALTVRGFAGAGLDDIYGRYAPQADCSAGPIIAFASDGITFELDGRNLHPPVFEIAYSYWGRDYEGIQLVIMPFRRSDSDYGASILIVNADEVPGKVSFEIGNPPGTAAELALAEASPYLRCGPAAPPSPVVEAAPTPLPVPLEWRMLPAVAGSFEAHYDIFGRGEIADALRALIGDRIVALQRNLSVRGTIERAGGLYFLSGNAEHLGGEEQAYVLMDPARKQVQVGLWERGKLTVYAPAPGRLPLPAALEQFLIQSPPETALALPGTPWEVIHTADQLPLATVDAAGSPDIQSFSLFCDHGRPKLAMLLNKRAPGRALTLTWNFSGRTIDMPLGQGNPEATFWLGWLDGSPLVRMLSDSSGIVYLRMNGKLEGQASLTGASPALRTALRECVRI